MHQSTLNQDGDICRSVCEFAKDDDDSNYNDNHSCFFP